MTDTQGFFVALALVIALAGCGDGTMSKEYSDCIKLIEDGNSLLDRQMCSRIANLASENKKAREERISLLKSLCKKDKKAAYLDRGTVAIVIENYTVTDHSRGLHLDCESGIVTTLMQ